MRTTWWIVILIVLVASALAVAGAWGAAALINNRVSASVGSAAPGIQVTPQPGQPGFGGGQNTPPGSGCLNGQMHPWSDRMPGPFGRDGSRRMPMMPGGRGMNRGTW